MSKLSSSLLIVCSLRQIHKFLCYFYACKFSHAFTLCNSKDKECHTIEMYGLLNCRLLVCFVPWCRRTKHNYCQTINLSSSRNYFLRMFWSLKQSELQLSPLNYKTSRYTRAVAWRTKQSSSVIVIIQIGLQDSIIKSARMVTPIQQIGSHQIAIFYLRIYVRKKKDWFLTRVIISLLSVTNMKSNV